MIFITAIIAIINFSSAALSVNKLLEHTKLQMNTLQKAAPGKRINTTQLFVKVPALCYTKS